MLEQDEEQNRTYLEVNPSLTKNHYLTVQHEQHDTDIKSLRSSARKSHQPITKEIDLNDDAPSYEVLPFTSAPSTGLGRDSKKFGKAAGARNTFLKDHGSTISEEAPVCYTELVEVDATRQESPEPQLDQLEPISKTAMTTKHQRTFTHYVIGATYRPLATESESPTAVKDMSLEFTSKVKKGALSRGGQK